jgi:hypothetical protein
LHQNEYSASDSTSISKRTLGNINLLWLKTHYAIRRAIDQDRLRTIPTAEGTWLYLPSTPIHEVHHALTHKEPIYRRWTDASGRAGTFAQGLVRRAFEAAGHAVSDPTIVVVQSGEKSIRFHVDVPMFSPITAWSEIKNKLSEVYIAPTIKEKSDWTEDDEEIDQLFKLAHQENITPILFASLVDPSFYGYQSAYKGLFCQFLFQYFPESQQQLCNDVREQFLIGHVKATNDPPTTWSSGLLRSLTG